MSKLALSCAFLIPVFSSFVQEKWDAFTSIQEHIQVPPELMFIDPETGKPPYKGMLEELNLEESEFSERFITPWVDLTSKQLSDVLRIWNFAFRFRIGQELVLQPFRELSALQWTVIQVYKLNLPGLVVFNKSAEYFETAKPDPQTDMISLLFQAEPYCLPVRQCFFCGRLDEDPRGKPFAKQGLTLCHLERCQTHSANLPDHDKHCCYREWNRRKDSLKRTLKNRSLNQEKAIDIFLMFCQKRFEANLLIPFFPRAEKEKPFWWKQIWSDMAYGHNRV